MKLKYDKKNWISFIVGVGIILIGIVFDQLTKSYFHQLSKQGELPIIVIKGVLEFDFALNDGAAWGSFSGNSIMFFVLTVVALPIFCYIFLTRVKQGWWSSIGFSMVISGTIGNAIDRLFLGDGFFNGAVRDFAATKFLGRMDFICNIADVFLTVGIVVVILGMMFLDSDAIFRKENNIHTEKNSQNKSEIKAENTFEPNSMDEQNHAQIDNPDVENIIKPNEGDYDE